MQKQSYYFSEYGSESNMQNLSVPFQVNCCGANLFKDKNFNTANSIRHDFYYFYLLSGDYTLNNNILIPGDVIITPPETMYHGYSNNGFNYLWVHYTGFEAMSFTQSKIGNIGTKKHIGLHQDICTLFEKMYREFIIADSSSKEISVCLLKEILLLSGRYIDCSSEKQSPLTSIKYIHEHFTEEIPIDALAEMEHVSANTYRIMFKNHTGVSPNEYIITQRIHSACTMLTQTKYSIKEIASSVGYNDQYYFSRLFTKKNRHFTFEIPIFRTKQII